MKEIDDKAEVPIEDLDPATASDEHLAPAAKCYFQCPLAAAASHAPSMHPLPATEAERRSA